MASKAMHETCWLCLAMQHTAIGKNYCMELWQGENMLTIFAMLLLLAARLEKSESSSSPPSLLSWRPDSSWLPWLWRPPCYKNKRLRGWKTIGTAQQKLRIRIPALVIQHSPLPQDCHRVECGRRCTIFSGLQILNWNHWLERDETAVSRPGRPILLKFYGQNAMDANPYFSIGHVASLRNLLRFESCIWGLFCLLQLPFEGPIKLWVAVLLGRILVSKQVLHTLKKLVHIHELQSVLIDCHKDQTQSLQG